MTKKIEISGPQLQPESPQQSPITQAPLVDNGQVMVAFSQEELSNLANLMSITAQTFETLALQAAQQNDESSFTVLSARNKLCRAYAARLIQFVRVGEPTSRDFH